MNEKKKTLNKGYKEIIKNREFMKSTIAMAITRFGDSMNMIAYSWIVYEITGSPATIAILYGFNSIPSLIFGLFSGAIVSYFPKKLVMFICDFARGFINVSIAILYISGNLVTWHLFLFAFLESIFEVFRSPASTAQTATILSKEEYTHGISFKNTLSQVLELLGLGVVGILIAIIGSGGVIVVNAVTFFICGLIIITIKNDKDIISSQKISAKNVVDDFKEGIKYFKFHKIILYMTIFNGFIAFFAIPINSMLAPYIDTVLKSGPSMMSVFSAAFTISMIFGGIIIPKIMKKFSFLSVFSTSGIIVGLAYLGLILIAGLPRELIGGGLILTSGALGLGCIGMNAVANTVIMSKTDTEYISRVSSFSSCVMYGVTPVGSFLVSYLCTFLSIAQLFVVFSIGLTIIFICVRFNKVFKENMG